MPLSQLFCPCSATKSIELTFTFPLENSFHYILGGIDYDAGEIYYAQIQGTLLLTIFLLLYCVKVLILLLKFSKIFKALDSVTLK